MPNYERRLLWSLLKGDRQLKSYVFLFLFIVIFTNVTADDINAPSYSAVNSNATCGIFDSVLTSYDSIDSYGNNDQACYTDTISYPNGTLTGDISCNASGCGGGSSCSRIDPPVNRYSHDFPTNSKSGSSNGSNPTTLTDLEYGDLSYSNTSVTLDPATSYSDNSTKVMMLGDVTIEKTTLNFEPGDYYFDSLTFNSNNNNVVLPSGGIVRIFIKNDLAVSMNNLAFNTSGSESDILVYVAGDYTSVGNGGGTTSWKSYMYVKGSVTLNNNSNNWKIYGGLTAEGKITINGNNPDFIKSGSADGFGLGSCGGGSPETPETGIFDAWETTGSISNRDITTKIANKPFTLVIASLNDDKDALQAREDANIRYQLYDYDTGTEITPFVSLDMSGKTTSNVSFSGISGAYKNVRVRVEYSSEDSSSENDNEHGNSGNSNGHGNDHGNNGNGYGHDNNNDHGNNGNGNDHGNSSNDDNENESDSSSEVSYFASSDNFAIRPDSFMLTTPTGENINLLTSAQDYSFPLTAVQYGTTTATPNYTVSVANSLLTLNRTMYQPTDTVDNTLNGTLAFSSTPFSITNGSANALINFDDVGKVNIQLQDTSWADVDSDDTSGDCSSTGRYICGDINATFIPDHFTISDAHLNNENHGTFTYLSDDLNMSAHLDVNITAKNLDDDITQNFTSDSWENPVDINISISSAASTPTLKKDDINETQKLGFSSGSIIIPWNESNSTKRLMFNFDREKDNSKNPFKINGSEITLKATSKYNDSGDTKTVTGSNTADQSATFIYGRTHAPRYRFESNSGTAFIYYESFCSGTDSSGNSCNKSLLPNGTASLSKDDPRWFTNTLHTTAYGTVNTVSQKGGATSVTATTPSSTNPAQSTLTYVDSSIKGYPYKTTMQNTASSWLIYNRYNASATTNEFEVEFEDSKNDWIGVNDSNVTTKQSGTKRTNRRTMW